MCILYPDRYNSRMGIPALPMYHITLKAQKPSYSPYPVSLTTIGDHIKKKRLDLNLFQKDVAKLIGVERDCIYNWENNISKPQIHLLPKIIEFLGYTPDIFSTKTLGEKIIMYRKIHGLSQKKFANILSIDQTTLRRWEKDKYKKIKKIMNCLEASFEEFTLRD
ncbi:MAG: helix-turn-helix transcriptional regulator [Ignavibacteriaceae bacterium]